MNHISHVSRMTHGVGPRPCKKMIPPNKQYIDTKRIGNNWIENDRIESNQIIGKNKSSDDSPDEISMLLNVISNKYKGNAEMKDLNQMYDVGIMMTNKEFNKEKLSDKLTKIIDAKSDHYMKDVRDQKKAQLLRALQQGITDGSSDEYRNAYDTAGRYQYSDKHKLRIRGRIDGVMDSLKLF